MISRTIARFERGREFSQRHVLTKRLRCLALAGDFCRCRGQSHLLNLNCVPILSRLDLCGLARSLYHVISLSFHLQIQFEVNGFRTYFCSFSGVRYVDAPLAKIPQILPHAIPILKYSSQLLRLCHLTLSSAKAVCQLSMANSSEP
jgi:hypothetical protein